MTWSACKQEAPGGSSRASHRWVCNLSGDCVRAPDQAQAGVRARLAQLEAQMNEEQGWVRGGTKAEVWGPSLPVLHVS